MILITGAAGKTGLALLRSLQDQGIQTRAFVRNKKQAKQVEEAGASEFVLGNLEIESDLLRAMRGVEALYFIPPNIHPQEDEIGKSAIVAALKMGLSRFVYHSVLFPQIEAMPHHWRKLRVEEALIQSSLNFTILQPANYMQNILAYKNQIISEGVWTLPYAPEARTTPVDLQDVTQAASKVLLNSGHHEAIYPLAGPKLLSSIDMLEQLRQVKGVQSIVQRGETGAWDVNSGLDKDRAETLKHMFAYYDNNDFVGNSKVLEMLLGRPPTLFEDFLLRDWK